MPSIHSLWTIAGIIFVINLPFGFWRAGVKRLSISWFVAIHAPVVLSIGIRILAGVPLRVSTLPLFVIMFFLGQSIGGRLRAGRSPVSGRPERSK